MSGGGFQVRNTAPHVQAIYPTAQWAMDEIRSGGHVYRRRVIVVQDWEELTLSDASGIRRQTMTETGHPADPATVARHWFDVTIRDGLACSRCGAVVPSPAADEPCRPGPPGSRIRVRRTAGAPPWAIQEGPADSGTSRQP